MSEKPILFSGPMVRALLDGRKTQTRRVVRYNAACGEPAAWCGAALSGAIAPIIGDYRRFCPHGQQGDQLWVREAWAHFDVDGDSPRRVVYRVSASDADGLVDGYAVKWRPSIHMPRWASRLTLSVKAVRVERVQDISEADAVAEGSDGWIIGECVRTYKDAFQDLWDSINAKRGYGWDVNPWVWVIEFEVVT